MEDKETDKKYRSLAEEYQDLKQDRQPYLDKAKEAAKYTIPSLKTYGICYERIYVCLNSNRSWTLRLVYDSYQKY